MDKELELAEKNVGSFKELVLNVRRKAGDLEVRDEGTVARAIDYKSEAKKLLDAVETDRRKITDPLNQVIKIVNEKYKALTENLRAIIQDMQFKTDAYIRRVQEDLKEKQAKEQERIDAQHEKAEEKAKKNGLIAPAKPIITVTTLAFEGKRSDAKLSIKSEWVGEVEDFAKLPDSYKFPNDVKIRVDVRSGVRVIPGVRIFEKTTTAVRG